nr:DUF2637 domain-containing protein [Streptomyces sp. NBC_00886]
MAAYASYVHQREFALQGGADTVSASLWPLSVDGLLLLATVGPDAVLMASGLPPRHVRTRMRHGTLAMTLDTYGFALEVDWENAPAPFEELFEIPAPPSLSEAALGDPGGADSAINHNTP